MGWTFNCYPQPRAAFVAECIRTQGGHYYDKATGGEVAAEWITAAHRDCLNHLWKLVEIRARDDSRVLKTFIALDLIKCSRGEWGYKDLCESMGPCELDCPPNWFDKVPCPQDGEAWRAKCREYHVGKRARAKLVKTIAPGQRWQLTARYGGKACEVVAPVRSGGWLVSIEGTTYRAKPRMFGRMLGNKEVTINQFMAGCPGVREAMQAQLAI